MQNLDVRRAKRILLTQAALTLVLVVVALTYGVPAAASALIGGVTATLANAVFAMLVFGRYHARDPDKLVFRFYGAELLKLLVIALTFAVVFVWVKPLSLFALFGTFLLVQIVPPLLANKVAR